MRNVSPLLTLALIASLSLSGCGKRELPSEISWFEDFQSGQTEAQRLGHNMLIDFYTDWCTWCKVLDDSVYTDPNFIQMSAEMVLVKIDAEKDTLNAEKYGISGFPTVLLLKPDGSEIDRIYGYMPAPDFINQINLYLEGRETLEDYLARLEESPADIEVNYTLAEKYEARSQHQKAASYYSKVLELDSGNQSGKADHALMNLGFSFYRQKEYQKAIEVNTEFVKRFPTSELKEDVIVYIPYFYAKWGKKEKALKLYNQYLQAYPEGENVEWVNRQMAKLSKEGS
jgi:tetratricopeptide (TPR) repeat protein